VLIIGGLIVLRNTSTGTTSESRTTQYDTFAQCLTDAGAKFYGAYWCPHCKDQKKLFDNSAKLPYVECSTPNGQGQLQICIDEAITGYPTWKFADGSVENGNQTLEQLSEKTSCPLPQV
jgi:thiol-disulfide isomerase/thioredoxin